MDTNGESNKQMKLPTTLAIAICLSSIAAEPARAGWRWPYIGATTFCQYKQMGADHKSALKAAMADGYDSSWHDKVIIQIDDQQYKKGFIDLFEAIEVQCPQHLDSDSTTNIFEM